MSKTVLAVLALCISGVAFGQPRTTTWNKTKICGNETHSILITYDLLDYANGAGNKVVIVKGFQILSGASVGIVAQPYTNLVPLKKTGFTLFAGLAATQAWSVIIDVVNGSNDGDYENSAHYSVITGMGCALD